MYFLNMVLVTHILLLIHFVKQKMLLYNGKSCHPKHHIRECFIHLYFVYSHFKFQSDHFLIISFDCVSVSCIVGMSSVVLTLMLSYQGLLTSGSLHRLLTVDSCKVTIYL